MEEFKQFEDRFGMHEFRLSALEGEMGEIAAQLHMVAVALATISAQFRIIIAVGGAVAVMFVGPMVAEFIHNIFNPYPVPIQAVVQENHGYTPTPETGGK